MTISNQLTEYLAARQHEYVRDLQQLCAIDSPSGYAEGIDAVGAWVQRRIMAHGWGLRRFSDAHAGDSLVLNCHGQGSLRVLLAAHLDTVYPVGTSAERPAQLQTDRLIAPGCVDNRAGILSGIYAIEALAELGLLGRFGQISLALGSDEETDARVSRRMFAELAPHHDLALILEPARPSGEIVVARKGNGTFTLTCHGRAAHAGVDPERGINANVALAHKVIALHALNDYPRGISLNVGAVNGGTALNVVPASAQAMLDVRVRSQADCAPLEAAIRAIAAQPSLAGATCEVSGGWEFAPMDQTAASRALLQIAEQAAAELGFGLPAIATGGISYGNLLAGLGMACLDGLGPIGGKLHSPEEYLEISSIVPRTALLALLMLRLAEQ